MQQPEAQLAVAAEPNELHQTQNARREKGEELHCGQGTGTQVAAHETKRAELIRSHSSITWAVPNLHAKSSASKALSANRSTTYQVEGAKPGERPHDVLLLVRRRNRTDTGGGGGGGAEDGVDGRQ